MIKMQAEAATAVPGNAPIAAYLHHLPQPVPADLLGSLIATEAKAVHQVIRARLLPSSHHCFGKHSLCAMRALCRLIATQVASLLHTCTRPVTAQLSLQLLWHL